MEQPTSWDVALTDDEIASLAAGADPTSIRPEHIIPSDDD